MSIATTSLPGLQAAGPSAVDAREHPRHTCQVRTTCKPPGANELRWQATIEDISQKGIRITLTRRFERGTCLAIELPGKEGEDPYTALVRVIHQRPGPDGSWTHGCRMVGELSDEELDRLLELESVPAKAGKPATAKPTGPNVVENVFVHYEGPTGQTIAWHVRRFHVGDCWPLLSGTIVKMRGLSHRGKKAQGRFRVLRCEPHDGTWEMEVQPVTDLS